MANKRWVQDGEKHVLYFERFYEEDKIAEVFCDDDGGWCFSSEMLGKDAEYLCSDTLEDAKRDVESSIEEYFENERDYFEEMLQKFTEE